MTVQLQSNWKKVIIFATKVTDATVVALCPIHYMDVNRCFGLTTFLWHVNFSVKGYKPNEFTPFVFMSVKDSLFML